MQKVLDASTKDTPDVVIGRFWNDPNNKTIVDSFMNNKLCINAAKGDRDALEAFKKYAVQDYFYLVDWVGFRALRFATLPHDDFNLDALDNELASVSRTTSYVKDWFQTCINNLGVTESQFKVERSIAEIAYAQFLQNNARSDDWYNLHVILIGCYWAWCKLALKLYNDPTTDKTTTFYKYWIQANLDLTNPNQPDFTSSAKALSLFLDQNESAWSSSQSRTQATDLFRSALRLEVALFDSGYETPTPRVQ
ncbi:heme oxygenase-like protein [Punctularia strigosozonata HHB-11173 SS5]|uniref:Heme oxygenase-like protein n=1 Tax=Punctularia strigosozonata (strain HHB-11173) TaxID=741275 RepID=R7RYT4_PUNST|nr:heme oxygenase-like protein [Punctularia strigosozonata HHB-11173 SS5]EIN03265.1 heme oxygenase-like protein [Punctularia strigosozonata HHB-11173 SS5]